MRGRFNGRVIGQDYTGRNTRHNGRAGVYNAVQSAFAPSLDITLANGLGPLFTFTRATTATVKDFEGLIKSCLSGELRIQGARRVENKATRTESLDNAAWTRLNANIATGVSAPDGTSTAYTLTATGANGEIYQALTTIIGTLHRGSWWIRRRTGSGTVSIYQNNGATAISDPSITWQRMTPAAAGAATATTVYSGIKLATSGDAVDLWHPQLQDVTGQAVQTPDEYVPNDTGVYSSPFSGYFASGVKYFSYENGNTVASNVVTEATGAAITGTIGYLAEGARTNLCLQSQTFDNGSWSKYETTVTANAVTAPDGTTTADKNTPSSTNDVHGTYQASLGGAGVYTASIYVKEAGYNTAQLYIANGGFLGTVTARLDLGTIVVGGSASPSGTITALPDDWYRITITATAPSASEVGVYVGNDGSVAAFVGDTTSGIYQWGAQYEAAAFASTYIPTTTAAVARNADVLTCAFAGIGNDAQGAAYIEAVTFSTTGNGSSSIPLAFSSNGSLLYLNSGDARTVANSYDGTTVVTKTGLTDISTALRKRACSWGNGGMSITGDGAAPATSVFDGSLGSTSITIGAATGGTSQWFGVIKTVRLYRTKLSDAQLQSMTS